MKKNKKKEQFEIAKALYELGLDFEVIEDVAGVTAQEFLMSQANLIDFPEETHDNKGVKKNKPSYQEPRHKGTNKRGSSPE